MEFALQETISCCGEEKSELLLVFLKVLCTFHFQMLQVIFKNKQIYHDGLLVHSIGMVISQVGSID